MCGFSLNYYRTGFIHGRKEGSHILCKTVAQTEKDCRYLRAWLWPLRRMSPGRGPAGTRGLSSPSRSSTSQAQIPFSSKYKSDAAWVSLKLKLSSTSKDRHSLLFIKNTDQVVM
jgi:hypothetical protein